MQIFTSFATSLDCIVRKLILKFCVMWQHFADILAAEADSNGIEAKLVDLSDCEPEDDLTVSVIGMF